MPKTINIPRRTHYKYLRCIGPFRKKEYIVEEMEKNRIGLRIIWDDESRFLKPIYLNYDGFWWRIFAIDWETKEVLLMEEIDESKMPDFPNEKARSFVESIIQFNKDLLQKRQEKEALKNMFKYYRENEQKE